jgi:hypothetical protein
MAQKQFRVWIDNQADGNLPDPDAFTSSGTQQYIADKTLLPLRHPVGNIALQYNKLILNLDSEEREQRLFYLGGAICLT